jgi:hypothetical protein
MRHLIDAVRRSVQEKNWYAALTGALTLPDVASRLDGRTGWPRDQYGDWFNDYLRPTYTRILGNTPPPHIFLSGGDCYALRCAYLHEGDFDLAGHGAAEVLDRFEFVEIPGVIRHMNVMENQALGTSVLQLQVSLFCEEICQGVERWLSARGADVAVAAALARLPEIQVTI